jgi:hypothetical protein
MHESSTFKKQTPEALTQTVVLVKCLQARRTAIAEMGILQPNVGHNCFFSQETNSGEGRGDVG